MIRAINKGNFITWPGLTSSLIKNHLTKSIATAKCHLDQERKNLQTTKPTIKIEDEELDYSPIEENGVKTQHCFLVLTDFNEMKKAYLDLTGRFPHKSSRGNQYILIVYDYDSNAILSAVLKTRQAAEIKRAWLKLHTKLEQPGATPNVYIMDNEASTDLKSAMTKNKLQYQLVPPDMHRKKRCRESYSNIQKSFSCRLVIHRSEVSHSRMG